MQLFPAIDLRGGKVVRLTQGDYSRMTVYGEDPCAQARQFLTAGAKNLQNFASLFRETKLRAHEYQFKCCYVVRQMLSFIICHIVLYKIV